MAVAAGSESTLEMFESLDRVLAPIGPHKSESPVTWLDKTAITNLQQLTFDDAPSIVEAAKAVLDRTSKQAK